jgi:hypothetical protein
VAQEPEQALAEGIEVEVEVGDVDGLLGAVDHEPPGVPGLGVLGQEPHLGVVEPLLGGHVLGEVLVDALLGQRQRGEDEPEGHGGSTGEKGTSRHLCTLFLSLEQSTAV